MAEPKKQKSFVRGCLIWFVVMGVIPFLFITVIKLVPTLLKDVRSMMVTEEERQAKWAAEDAALQVRMENQAGIDQLIREQTAKTRLLDQEMVYVPSGVSMVGSERGDAAKKETPARQVHLNAFYIDTYEVTCAQYQACVDAGRCPPLAVPRAADMYDFPVTDVRVETARIFCKWASKRLPTADEWEKAARGTDEREYPWGNAGVAENKIIRANFGDRDYGSQWGKAYDSAGHDGWGGLAPVGRYLGGASAYGAMDMAGNVAEYIDVWDLGGGAPVTYFMRGGSWAQKQEDLRAWKRAPKPSEKDQIGFRCARTAQPGDGGKGVQKDSTKALTDAEYYRILAEKGKVDLVYEFSRSQSDTRFTLHWPYRYNNKHTAERRDGRTYVSFAPNIRLSPEMRHKIQMPGQAIDRFHEMLAFEYDRVAISLDERPLKLLHFLVGQIDTLRFDLEGSPKVDRKAFTTHIEFEVRKYTQQIANLISFNYRSIVGRTVNGTFPLKNREDFFKSLYTRENLEAAQFEFLPQVEGLLSSPDYVQAKRYYSRAAFLKESGAVEEGAGNL